MDEEQVLTEQQTLEDALLGMADKPDRMLALAMLWNQYCADRGMPGRSIPCRKSRAAGREYDFYVRTKDGGRRVLTSLAAMGSPFNAKMLARYITNTGCTMGVPEVESIVHVHNLGF